MSDDAIHTASVRGRKPLELSPNAKFTVTLGFIVTFTGAIWTVKGAYDKLEATTESVAAVRQEVREERAAREQLAKDLSALNAKSDALRNDIGAVATGVNEIKSALGLKVVATTPPIRFAGGRVVP